MKFSNYKLTFAAAAAAALFGSSALAQTNNAGLIGPTPQVGQQLSIGFAPGTGTSNATSPGAVTPLLITGTTGALATTGTGAVAGPAAGFTRVYTQGGTFTSVSTTTPPSTAGSNFANNGNVALVAGSTATSTATTTFATFAFQDVDNATGDNTGPTGTVYGQQTGGVLNLSTVRNATIGTAQEYITAGTPVSPAGPNTLTNPYTAQSAVLTAPTTGPVITAGGNLTVGGNTTLNTLTVTGATNLGAITTPSVTTGAVIATSVSAGAGPISTTGPITGGAITGAAITGTSVSAGTGALTGGSLNVGSGSITGGATSITTLNATGLATLAGGVVTNNAAINAGTGAISGGAITGTSLNVGTGSVTAGAITGASLNVGTGAVNAGAVNAASVNTTGNVVVGGTLTVKDATAANQAVSLGQSNAAIAAAFAPMGGQISTLNNKVEQNDKRASSGIAGALAVANIPAVEAGKTGSFGIGLGNYNGQTSVAAGVTYRINQMQLKGSISGGSGGKVGVGVGAGFGF